MTSPYLLHPPRSLAEALLDLQRRSGVITHTRRLARAAIAKATQS